MSDSNLNFLERDYTFKFEKYFDRGWEIFQKYIGGFIGFGAFNFIAALLLSSGVSDLPTLRQASIVSLFSLLITPAFIAGYYIVALEIAENKSPSFADFFDGFKKYLPILLVTVISGVLVFLGFIFILIPGIYLAVCYSFALIFVVEYDLNPWAALETSRKVIQKKWFAFFGFVIVLGGIDFFAAFFLWGLPAIVTNPFTSCTLIAAFEDIVGFNKGVNLEKEV